MFLELHVERPMRLGASGKYHDAGCGFVETMDDPYLPVFFFQHPGQVM
jgi:hypothetical protein